MKLRMAQKLHEEGGRIVVAVKVGGGGSKRKQKQNEAVAEHIERSWKK